jgi:hypothetical protein
MIPKLIQLAKRGFQMIRSWFKGDQGVNQSPSSQLMVPPA